MLDENDVVNAVCDYLKAHDWIIVQKCLTNQRGIDIVARRLDAGGQLLIEAKGATSSKKGSARYDLGFNMNQVFDRVAKMLLHGRLYPRPKAKVG